MELFNRTLSDLVYNAIPCLVAIIKCMYPIFKDLGTLGSLRKGPVLVAELSLPDLLRKLSCHRELSLSPGVTAHSACGGLGSRSLGSPQVPPLGFALTCCTSSHPPGALVLLGQGGFVTPASF